MSNHRSRLPLVVGTLLASLTVAAARLSAGEVLIRNSNFDDLAPSPAWSREASSLAGSTVTYDGAVNAAGGAVGSGALRLSVPFDAANSGWQEATFTLDVVDFDASKLDSLSVDVMVDPNSTPRLEGDYGNIQVILRNG